MQRPAAFRDFSSNFVCRWKTFQEITHCCDHKLCRDVTGYEAYAEQLAIMFKGNRKLLEDVLEGLATSCRARIRDVNGSLLGEGESGP